MFLSLLLVQHCGESRGLASTKPPPPAHSEEKATLFHTVPQLGADPGERVGESSGQRGLQGGGKCWRLEGGGEEEEKEGGEGGDEGG